MLREGGAGSMAEGLELEAEQVELLFRARRRSRGPQRIRRERTPRVKGS